MTGRRGLNIISFNELSEVCKWLDSTHKCKLIGSISFNCNCTAGLCPIWGKIRKSEYKIIKK
jgi:hypothetical protein